MRSLLSYAIAFTLMTSGCIADGVIEGTSESTRDRGVKNSDSGATIDDDTGSELDEDSSVPTEEDSSVPPEEDTFVPGEDAPAIDSSMPPPKDTGTVDTGTKDTAVTDTYVPPPDTTPPPPDSATGWPAAYAALEQGILEETNKRRAAGADCHSEGKFGPAGPLVMQPQLQSSARKHSQDMAQHNYFSHTDLSGGSPFDRMKAEGYTGGWMGENIAAGNSTVAATMDQWMNSDGHCANIMNPKYTQLGVGYFYTSTSTYKHYWTQNFGAP
jgi:uncharacterized protein YkwD